MNPRQKTDPGREHRMRVLAVDDEEVMGYLIQRIGKRMGFVVDWVRDGQAALKKLQSEPYDVILSDYFLREMTGEFLYYAIAETRPDLLDRLIFMTGDSLNSRLMGFLRKNDVPCISKPFDIDQLQSMIFRITPRLPA